MAKLLGTIKFTGTIDNLCFYEMRGQHYVRMKSSLTGKRVKTSPKFRLTMVYAGLMGRASRIGSVIYGALPKAFREFWMYRAFTGEAMQWLKTGKADEEVKEILWKTYVEVWECKEVEKLQQPVCDAPATGKVSVQKPGRSTIKIKPKISTGPIDSLFLIPGKKSAGKIKPGDAGRRVLRRPEQNPVFAFAMITEN